MYSSATRSSSASGFSGGGLFVGLGFGEGVGEEDSAGDGEGEDFDRGVRVGFSVGVGAASCNGFTGPVGRRGGAGLALGVGEGEGEVAAGTIAAPRWNSSAKINGRDLMELRRAHLRRRFARCQKFPHERSSWSLQTT